MTKLHFLLTLFLFPFFGCDKSPVKESNTNEITIEEVKTNFTSLPKEYGVNCWWWWLNGNVNKASISKDLQAMKSRNFQGATILDAGGHNQRGNRDIPSGPLFGSNEWIDLFVFALDEARRLDLKIGFNIQSGWNLGGPRVPPHYAAKQITYSEVKVTSGEENIVLKKPNNEKDFYKDIVVLAFPLKKENRSEKVITDRLLKLGYRELGGSAPDTRFLLDNEPGGDQRNPNVTTYVISKEDIIDLSGKMNNKGKLDWQVPDGEWVVLRVGYTCTDAHVSTPSGDWQGNVLDYMSKEAFDFYWKDVVAPILTRAGNHVGSTLKHLATESWECGGMNWTDKFSEEFIQYRGYDLTNYLPIAAGYVVEDVETSNAFLADFRKTLGDLVAYNHYARFQEYAHEHNMGIQPESAGPHAGPLDGIKNYGFSDIVMSEFWSPSPHRPLPENRFFLKQASSAAHIYGQKIVGAESFTTIGPHWNDELWHDQKSSFDHEICAGLNRMYFHTFTASPPEMGLPGQEYFAGTHVNPQVTWWDQSAPFIDYIHRTQAVVQEGKFVADVLYYYGDHVPNVFPYKHWDPAGTMPGFDYDVTDENILLQTTVKEGKIIVSTGLEYEVLVLPDHKVLSMAALEKVEELLQAGGNVIGNKALRLVSLVGGDEDQTRFDELSDKIWGNETTDKGTRKYRNGTVSWGMTAKDYLVSKDIPVDFDVVENDSKTDFGYIHYAIGDADVYFVTNQTINQQKIVAEFRVTGKQPELWDALNGEIRNATAFTQEGGITSVPLTLEPYGSIMIVFNEEIDNNGQGDGGGNYPDYNRLLQIDGPWKVSFDPDWGGPESVIFPELMDWSKHADDGIKYYSGAATYHKTFNFDPDDGSKYFLQLGSVKDVGIAEVKINGKDKGILWTKPFRVEITQEIQDGINELEIKVVNSWYNRVAGDQTFPERKQYTNTNILLNHDFRGRPIEEILLESSGLLGPVIITQAIIRAE